MDHTRTLAIVSDIHYASAAEQARGWDYEFRGIPNPLLRLSAKFYRNYIWLRDPLRQNHLLDRFLGESGTADYLVANGDYSCNSAFIGLSDDASFASAQECLGKMRRQFGDRFRATYGDHEIGKKSMFAGRGAMLLASLRRAQYDLNLPPFWQMEIGNYTLVGVASSLIALPIFEKETLPDERSEWERVRAEHLGNIRAAFSAVKPEQRILLFCHDPTALPFLRLEPSVQSKLAQIEQTVIGHLHTNLVLGCSRLLAGMPPIRFLGNTTRRLTTSLSQARHWRPFKVRLCPALAGIQLVKGGGYFIVRLDPSARQPAQFQFHRIPRKQSNGR
jgi:hypothetical protein